MLKLLVIVVVVSKKITAKNPTALNKDNWISSFVLIDFKYAARKILHYVI